MKKIKDISQLQNIESIAPVIFALLLIAGLCLSYKSPQHQTWVGLYTDYLKGLQPGQNDLILQATTFQRYNTWTLFNFLYGITCFLAIVIGGSVIYRYQKCKRGSLILVTSLLSSVGIGIIFHISQVECASNLCSSEDFWSQFLCHTLGEKVVQNSGSLHLWLDATGIGIIGFLAIVSSVILFSKDSNGAQDKTPIEAQMDSLRYILYVGSALLVTSTLRISALFHWAMAFLQLHPSVLESKDAALMNKTITDVISNTVTNLGVGYSFLLIAIYVPSALILNKRAKEEPEVEPKVDEKKTAKMLVFEQLMKLAAIMGPFLAGPIGELLSRLK